LRSSKITADVRAFFTSYCTAFIRQDAPAIAKHFADLVHVAGDRGDDVDVLIANAVEWRKTIDRLLDMYRAIDVGCPPPLRVRCHVYAREAHREISNYRYRAQRDSAVS
jgi:hypothetical protein